MYLLVTHCSHCRNQPHPSTSSEFRMGLFQGLSWPLYGELQSEMQIGRQSTTMANTARSHPNLMSQIEFF